ncbi:deoxyribodipyrimidine photo-lyase [Roseivirga sp. BDSF3-8]|uniref:cryptochrome/photolyase family protein n=1 Tax=Roseivirga sp. BDSF3-8 TaxID=3241598 RepID=UPI00353256E0
MSDKSLNVFWFRRDLRLQDNAGLYYALQENKPVLPVFIFDKHILDELEDEDDARVTFLHDRLTEMHDKLKEKGGGLRVYYGKPAEVWKELTQTYDVAAVYTNRDYEPYAKERDGAVQKLLADKGIEFNTFKDQVIFEKEEVLTGNNEPYKVFTPYMRTWMKKLEQTEVEPFPSALRYKNWYGPVEESIPTLEELGFTRSSMDIPPADADEGIIKTYDKTRDYPGNKDSTSRLGIHLRHGTIGIRTLVKKALELNDTYLNELIWREFYQMILYNFPEVTDNAFKAKYDRIEWRNNEEEFEKWREGKTGYPLVDAGMRQLAETGYMHNRVRMVTASFLTKHLLIDWRWGEAWFARKLLDFELASNNGGWQWAAGSGVDAQPYFRIFNPTSQLDKFDKDRRYVRRYVPEYGTDDYPDPIVDHKAARERCIEVYSRAVKD